MCGIAGAVHWNGRPVGPELLARMAQSLVHRGPDEQGVWSTPAGRPGPAAGLAHRRLSIIDLSTGQQPLSNEDGTVWIAFNGEIYNFAAVRAELIERGHKFRTRSDTEVIVHAYEEWGADCLRRLNGMFAFAIWDDRQRALFVARDRLGKKPLYYLADRERFLFGSELKAILACPGVPRDTDATAIVDYFKLLYVPDPKSIYASIRKLPPAHYAWVSAEGMRLEEYWDVQFTPDGAIDDVSAVEELGSLIDAAVRERMIAEVPLGAFLSGGVDSSGVVALMARASARPVKTCTVGFDDPAHDESRPAAAVAQFLRTDHSESRVTPDFAELVRRLPSMFDEPFADSSAIPTYLVSQAARQRVTVALSGDGGDESFAGYDKYAFDLIERMCARVIPRPVLAAVHAIASDRYDLGRRARTLTSQALRAPAMAYYRSNTFITDEALAGLLARGLAAQVRGYDPSATITAPFNRPEIDDHLSRMLYTDIKTYLPGDILVKVDRASMACSLEVRCPLLDYRVVEFAARLPNRLKLRKGERKYALRRAFEKLVPPGTFDRPKHGFTVPLNAWFRRDLVPLAEEAFFEWPGTAAVLETGALRSIWTAHRAGRIDAGTTLWTALMLALWQREHVG